MKRRNKQLQVLFPLSVLKRDRTIVDPSNTETTFEYYLLENLGSGLIRDDVTSLEGYAPVIAEQWEHTDARTWKFKLRKNLKWSDGTPMTGEMLAVHFARLAQGRSRHINLLRRIRSVDFDAHSNSLIFSFKSSVDQSLLHELSLADAVVTRPGQTDWSITSGPYFVKEYDWAKKVLLLERNDFCSLVNDESPKNVRLFALSAIDQLAEVFKTIETDIFYLPPPSFRGLYETARTNAAHEFLGQRTLIHFLAFNLTNELAQDKEARLLLKEIFAEALRNIGPKNGTYAYYDQLIPDGYSGRLESMRTDGSVSRSASPQRRFRVQILPAMQEIVGFTERLHDAAEKKNCVIEFQYSEKFENGVLVGDGSEVAHAAMFQGNQKDPIGSWGFLFADDFGPLRSFRTKLAVPLEDSSGHLVLPSDQKELKKIHQEILDLAYVIPFLVESNVVLTSDRVDLSGWNRFDMRLRLYDVRLK